MSNDGPSDSGPEARSVFVEVAAGNMGKSKYLCGLEIYCPPDKYAGVCYRLRNQLFNIVKWQI